ncbi:MAG: hypothetical protein JXB04_13320 [Kiritimatiellae bacterium]|nr:hypothetical protein [Kiritimatiellia bacterium]
MRKTIAVLGGVLLVATVSAAFEPIEISATKKTVDARKSAGQALWRGTSRATEKEILYRFDFKRRSAEIPEYVTAQWMVLVEGALGHVVAPRTSGESRIGLPLNQLVNLETEAFSLRGREWTSGPNPGTVEEQLIGYGVRLLNEQGAVLAEKYGPPSLKDSVDWEKLRQPIVEEPPPVRRRMLRRQMLDSGQP